MAPYHCLAQPRSRTPLRLPRSRRPSGSAVDLPCSPPTRRGPTTTSASSPPTSPPPPPGLLLRPPSPEPVHALADWSLDLEGAIPIQHSAGQRKRPQGRGRLQDPGVGDQFRVGSRVRLTPELGYAYDHMFANDDLGNVAYSWDMHRAIAGVRLSFGRYLVPRDLRPRRIRLARNERPLRRERGGPGVRMWVARSTSGSSPTSASGPKHRVRDHRRSALHSRSGSPWGCTSTSSSEDHVHECAFGEAAGDGRRSPRAPGFLGARRCASQRAGAPSCPCVSPPTGSHHTRGRASLLLWLG